MTGSPYGVTPGGSWQPPPPNPPVGSPPASKQSRTLVIVSLATALIAIAVAVGAWFRPTNNNAAPLSEPTPLFSEEDEKQATATVCDAYTKVRDAITTAGGQNSDDPDTRFIIAINARLAIHANASYLRQALADNPALPQEIARIFREMASAYDEILMGQLAAAPSDSFGEVNAKLDATDAEAAEACK